MFPRKLQNAAIITGAPESDDQSVMSVTKQAERKRMRNRILLLLSALAATGLMSLAATSAAQAAPAATTGWAASESVPTALPQSQPATAIANTLCPSGWFCVWHGPPRSGGWLGGNGHNLCYTPFNNNGNAVSDQMGTRIRVFASTGCHGSYFDLQTGHYSYPTPFTVRSVETF